MELMNLKDFEELANFYFGVNRKSGSDGIYDIELFNSGRARSNMSQFDRRMVDERFSENHFGVVLKKKAILK